MEPTAIAAVSALRAGGWTYEAIFRAPWFGLSDWLREHGEEATADALNGEGNWLIVGIRDHVWRHCDSATNMRLRPYIREVADQLAKKTTG